MQIHEKIRALREDHDLTQAEMATILKTERSYYGKYERGLREIPTEHIITICRYFKVSSDWILGLPKGLEYPTYPNAKK